MSPFLFLSILRPFLRVCPAITSIRSGLLGADGIFEDGDFDGDGMFTGADGAMWNQHSGYNLQNVLLLADLNGDWSVDESDAQILYDNWTSQIQNPTQADGDLDGDGDIDVNDLDLAFAQIGMGLAVVS